MKIAHTQPNYQVMAANQGVKKKNEKPAVQGKEYLTPSESISQTLKDAKNELSQMADVDLDKVVSIKTAIREGHIKVDPETLAIAMLKYHQR